MEAYPGQTRMYVVVGALLGIVVGVFMQSFLMDDRSALRLVWLGIFFSFGALLGKLLVVAQAPASPAAKPQPDPNEPPDDPEVSATRFFKLQSGVFSDEEFRRLRVRSVIMPMSPPDSELELQVRDYDHYARVPVLEGVLERLTAREVQERVRTEADARAPKVPGTLDLQLVSFHSEGPLAPDGRSPLGWSFYYVDGAAGLGCLATTTDREIALHFHTAATYSRPDAWDWVDLEDVLKWAETALPEWVDEDVRIRVNLPDDYLCFVSNPLRVADIDIVQQCVVNDGYLSESHEQEETERFVLSDLIAWFRAGDYEPESDFAAAIAQQEFADGLRTLQPLAIGRAATALERGLGPAIVPALVAALEECSAPEEQLELLHILSRVPTGLAEVALHRLSVDANLGDVSRVASELHQAWRNGEIDVPRHPLDSLSFLDVRQRMGRGQLAVVPLIPTYDPESDLLPVLSKMGFRESRRRLLSGSANLLVGARLRATKSHTEMLVTSTPLPVPCHILHVVGERAVKVSERVLRSPIAYPQAKILADATSRRPALVHPAALYIAALRIDDPSLTAPLIETAGRTKQHGTLQRAIIGALSVQSDPAAQTYIEAIASDPEHEDATVARAALRSPAVTGSAPSV